jgi:putative transcriptional regulator
MLKRKTLADAEAEQGYLDPAKFDNLSDAEIERLMTEDPDLAPLTENLAPLLGIADVRRKLGLTQQQLARKLCVSLATLREWERGPGRTDPAMQALLRILQAAPETALRALDEPARQGG